MSKEKVYDLSDVPEGVLLKEVKKRVDARETEAARRKKQLDEWVISNIDLLLHFIPHHERTSCSDEDPGNSGRARCSRCVLLALKGAPEIAEDYNFRFEIHPMPEDKA